MKWYIWFNSINVNAPLRKLDFATYCWSWFELWVVDICFFSPSLLSMPVRRLSRKSKNAFSEWINGSPNRCSATLIICSVETYTHQGHTFIGVSIVRIMCQFDFVVLFRKKRKNQEKWWKLAWKAQRKYGENKRRNCLHLEHFENSNWISVDRRHRNNGVLSFLGRNSFNRVHVLLHSVACGLINIRFGMFTVAT